jgi:G3E family GTPase
LRTPLTLVSGFLGSGKTTLLRHLLDAVPMKIAILMNEFGELAIDATIVAGRNVQVAELAGGCVCCSLIGEFEAAVKEIIETVRPEWIIVETTGLAEPDALVYAVREELPKVRLDGVITVTDADALARYPQLGHTTRAQIEAADLILLNKIDLVSGKDLEQAKALVSAINQRAPVVATLRTKVDVDLLFGLSPERSAAPPAHAHQPEFQWFSFASEEILDRGCFEQLLASLGESIYRAKGFVRYEEASYLFNYVGGRFEFERYPAEATQLVFIGIGAARQKETILATLRRCQKPF